MKANILGYIFRMWCNVSLQSGNNVTFKFESEQKKHRTDELNGLEMKHMGARPRAFCVRVESVARGFPVRCDLGDSTECNDLIWGNADCYDFKTTNC